VGPRLGVDAPAFLYDFPASQAALSRIRPDDPPVAERFELFWQGVELANGFHELGDAIEQRRRFEADQAWRRARDRAVPPMDMHLLDALASGLPDCAGVALGIDRLLMLKLGTPTLAQTLSFDTRRA
jgi:lysyl-tRNA synthetase class 2